ncbi:hypothetical protein [Parasitella parasitica]|uniref:Uncharacterized protein n=1 Tax=Parasitella parasitica TaxID=35722 RepID=A0A0B7NK47_9FUNG|nr:hypothetical protein [Parasitella parasitica]
MSETIAIVEDGSKTSDISHAPPSIANSTAYNKVMPWLLICVSTLYTSFVLFRYCSWQFRRRKVKRIRLERQKIEKFWRKHTARMNALAATSSIVQIPEHTALDDEEKSAQYWSSSFNSSATLVGILSSSDYYLSEQRYQMDLTDPVDEAIEHDKMLLPYSVKHYNTMQHWAINNTTHNLPKQRKSRKKRLASTIINRMNGNYQRKKKRQLLWQWSVAMGYCRYNHGHHLNTLIERLSEKQQKGIDESLSPSIAS